MRSRSRPHRTRAIAAILALSSVGIGLSAAPAAAYPDRPGAVGIDGACEGQLLKLHNGARTQAGLPKLNEDPAFDQVTRTWAERLASDQSLRHNPSYSQQIGPLVSWYTMGENVGYGGNAAELHNAYMNSPGHRANILSTRFQRVAIGCYRDTRGRIWTAVNFVGSLQTIPARVPAPFHSAADAVTRLHYWTLGVTPNNAVLDADTGTFLRGQTNVPGYALALVNKPAHVDSVPSVTRLYYAVFLRDPDVGGLKYWISLKQAGYGLDHIATMFAESAEFRSTYGSLSNSAFVELVYRNVLRRQSDPGGVAYWTNFINNGMTRGRMLIGFSESNEFRELTFDEVTTSWAFIQMLNRLPTAPERTLWATMFDNGGTANALVDSLVRSPAFTLRAQAHTY